MPGPAVAVSDRAPAQPAPMAMPMAASSSSAWTTAKVRLPSGPTRCFLRNSSAYSARLLDGVIGYQVRTLAPPNGDAQRRRLVPLDQDLLRGIVHPPDLEREVAGQVRLGPLEARPHRAMLISAALALRPGNSRRMPASTASISISQTEARTPT